MISCGCWGLRVHGGCSTHAKESYGYSELVDDRCLDSCGLSVEDRK